MYQRANYAYDPTTKISTNDVQSFGASWPWSKAKEVKADYALKTAGGTTVAMGQGVADLDNSDASAFMAEIGKVIIGMAAKGAAVAAVIP